MEEKSGGCVRVLEGRIVRILDGNICRYGHVGAGPGQWHGCVDWFYFRDDNVVHSYDGVFNFEYCED